MSQHEAFQPGEVCKLAPGVQRITAPNAGMMTGPGTNTYLVGEQEIAVIDPAVDDPAHLAAIEQAGQGRIRWILVTHNHPDHSTGARELARLTGAPVLAHPVQLKGVRNRDFRPDQHIEEGHELGEPGYRLRALHTPGHAADHLCFLLGGQQLLFAGDHVMEAVTVVILPPDGDMTHYLQALRRLRQEAITRIAPGHGGVMDSAQACFESVIEHRLAREAQILEWMGDARWRIPDLVKSIYQDVPQALHPVAEQQVHAHLLKLAGEGRVRGERFEDGWQRTD